MGSLAALWAQVTMCLQLSPLIVCAVPLSEGRRLPRHARHSSPRAPAFISEEFVSFTYQHLTSKKRQNDTQFSHVLIPLGCA